jgi:TolB-like protein
MTIYAGRGDRGLALTAYEQCAASLAEMSAAPSDETRALAERIRSNAAALSDTLSAPTPAADATAPVSAPPRPSDRGIRVGVMPFRALHQDGPDLLGIGLSEEITTALANFRTITLIASSSLMRLMDEPRENTAAWKRFDLDFLVDGSIQRSGDRVRVIARLVDMQSAAEVAWSRRFDRMEMDVLAMQEDIAAEVAAQVDPELQLRETKRTAKVGIDPDAHALLLQAIPSIHQLDRARFLAAGDTLASAVALAPNYSAAHAWWAYWYIFLHGQGWADNPEEAVARAEALAARALEIDPTDARATTIAGHIRSFLHHKNAEAAALHERALRLNPNLPIAWVFSGLTASYQGRHREAIERIDRARRLSPFDPHISWFDTAMMVPKLFTRDFAEVCELGERVAAVNARISTCDKLHLAALGFLGRLDEAHRVRQHLRELEPGYNVTLALEQPFERSEDRDLYAEGLRRGGLAET